MVIGFLIDLVRFLFALRHVSPFQRLPGSWETILR
jgi:hypothetical protein